MVILRLRGRNNLGATLLEVLDIYADKLAKVNGRLYLTGLAGQALQQVVRTGKFHRSAPVHMFEATAVRGESTRKAHAEAEEWLVYTSDGDGVTPESGDDRTSTDVRHS